MPENDITLEDGTIVGLLPDGSRVVKRPDGLVRISLLSGEVKEFRPGIVELDGGKIIETTDEGVTIKRHPDGLVVKVYPDGRVVKECGDGRVITEETHQGSVTVNGETYPCPVKSIKTLYPDGRQDCTVRLPRVRMGAAAKQPSS